MTTRHLRDVPRPRPELVTLVTTKVVNDIVALVAEVTIDRSYQCPYVAGVNEDCTTCYLGSDVPEKLSDGSDEFHSDAGVAWHECGEWYFMEVLGLDYDDAHCLVTWLVECLVVTKIMRLDFEGYQRAFDPYIIADEEEKITSVAPDLFLGPYEDDPGLLAAIRRAQGTTNKSFSLDQMVAAWEPDEEPETLVTRAAGVAYVAPGGEVLFVRRGNDQDHPGEWCLPGGCVEGHEGFAQAAAREFKEETGGAVDPERLQEVAHRNQEGVDYVTFLARGERFDPKINAESAEAAWCELTSPPSPLHPGVASILVQVAAAAGGSLDKSDTVSTATNLVYYDQTSASGDREKPLPWKTNDDLPAGVRNSLPAEAQGVFREVANRIMAGGGGEVSAIRQAWAAVKNGWSRDAEGNWSRKKKSEKILKGSTTMDNISFFMPITKKESQPDGSVVVTGYASTPTRDLDNEIISLDAVKKALPSYMEWRNVRAMHKPDAVGTAKEAHVDDIGLYLRARVVEPGAVHLVNEGVYQGFSIGGRKLAKTGDTVTDLELVEISLVDRPCNSDCFPGSARVSPVGAAVAVSSRQYDGEVVIIRTSFGHELTVTPNHPILSDTGWKAANALHVGNHVVSRDAVRGTARGGDDVDDGPPTIEEVSKTFRLARGVSSLDKPISTPDFHGDGKDGEVNVVWSHGHLARGVDPTVLEKHIEHLLKGCRLRKSLNRGGSLDKLLNGPLLAADGVLSWFGKLRTLFGSHFGYSEVHSLRTSSGRGAALADDFQYSWDIGSKFLGDDWRSFAAQVERYNLFFGQCGTTRAVSALDAAIVETIADCDAADAESLGEIFSSLAGEVSLDEIVYVGRREFSGYVYNLATESNILIADGIVAHNCRFAITKGANIVNPKRIDLVRVIESIGRDDQVTLDRSEVGMIGSLLAKLGLGRAPEIVRDVSKREFSDQQRASAADAGHAMPGGGFPIESHEDVGNAVQAFGRAKDPAATKRHITRQAKRIGATHLLPEDWPGSTKKKESTAVSKAASLYTVSSMISLLGQLEYLEECCEGGGTMCCGVPGQSDTVVECSQEFTDKFGSLLVEFADMTAELLDAAISKMKEEEAEEARAGAAGAAKAARAVGLTKAWSQEARDAAAEARRSKEKADYHSDRVADHAPYDGTAHEGARFAHQAAADLYNSASHKYESGDASGGQAMAQQAESAGQQADRASRRAYSWHPVDKQALSSLAAIAGASGAAAELLDADPSATARSAIVGKSVAFDQPISGESGDDAVSRLATIARAFGATAQRSPHNDSDALAELKNSFNLH